MRMRQYPLEWPEGFSRTRACDRRKHKFQMKLPLVVTEFKEYLASIKCTDLEISCNLHQPFGEKEMHADDFVAGYLNTYIQQYITGKTYGIRNFENWIEDIVNKERANHPTVDPGVVVRYNRTTRQNGLLVKRSIVLPCDKWLRVRDNLKAILSTIKNLEKISEWGVPEIQERTYEAIAVPALPAPPSCWAILGVPRGATEKQINDAWRVKCRELHPDMGNTNGSAKAQAEVNVARDNALKEIGAR